MAPGVSDQLDRLKRLRDISCPATRPSPVVLIPASSWDMSDSLRVCKEVRLTRLDNGPTSPQADIARCVKFGALKCCPLVNVGLHVKSSSLCRLGASRCSVKEDSMPLQDNAVRLHKAEHVIGSMRREGPSCMVMLQARSCVSLPSSQGMCCLMDAGALLMSHSAQLKTLQATEIAKWLQDLLQLVIVLQWDVIQVQGCQMAEEAIP